MATKDRQATTLALAHALSAAERGLAVIPLSRSKLPALRSPHRDDPTPTPCHGECGRFGHGVYDASTDPRRIRALFAAAPWAIGYGIACGLHPHHLIGVDLDTKSGTDSSAALRELALRHLFTIPDTVVILTPSGGRHLWLTGPPDVVVPNSASRLAPGIDIRGAGGYLVGPGSRTDHGVYGTVPGTAHLPPAPCPSALLRLLLPPPTREPRAGGGAAGRPGGRGLGRGSGFDLGGGIPAADGRGHGEWRGQGHPRGHDHGHGLIHFVLTAHEGQRNTRLFWAACRAYENGLGPDLANALIDAAIHTGLTEREARSTVASAARMSGRRG
ncbi:bifunctional DNA primase/polymerase [Streptomyces neyagawaensis]|uniref:bifunctional DNA primase/polymerase n=1 Tax=Streptomyces neyagawaensis TaxID=42238 RepID=UPI00201D11A3|nr:bifunctional DNA primase/polymerase [Streptomyces neyagawaensis]MCL6734245.1 bifunctional DNA primase/polymerase [Streptomyces neyagawaensis]MDE1681875.1 bifunctional DNA primase/polymerase [Streptomyces neyagawaensis]